MPLICPSCTTALPDWMLPTLRDTRQPLERIGFFHFGEKEKTDPFGALERLLERAAAHDALANSLLVLPEAFNIGGDYLTKSEPDPSVDRSLRSLSKCLGVCFVAGLIDKSKGGKSGFSRACLIDGKKAETLTYKADADDSPNYECHPIWDNPLPHRGLFLFSLICHDACDSNPMPRRLADAAEIMRIAEDKRARHVKLLAQMKLHLSSGRVVLCIPGRMTQIISEGLASDWAQRCPGSYVVVANATDKYSSVICYNGKSICSEKHNNAVLVWNWSDLD